MLLMILVLVGSAPVLETNRTPRRHLANLPSAAVKREAARDGTHELQTHVANFADLCHLMRALHMPATYDDVLKAEAVVSLGLLALMTVEELRSIGFKLGEQHSCGGEVLSFVCVCLSHTSWMRGT